MKALPFPRDVFNWGHTNINTWEDLHNHTHTDTHRHCLTGLTSVVVLLSSSNYLSGQTKVNLISEWMSQLQVTKWLVILNKRVTDGYLNYRLVCLLFILTVRFLFCLDNKCLKIEKYNYCIFPRSNMMSENVPHSQKSKDIWHAEI